jgi:hypothetical protein
MSDVVPLRERQAPRVPPTLERFGEDAWGLKLCGEWRAARAQQQRNWAEHKLATG